MKPIKSIECEDLYNYKFYFTDDKYIKADLYGCRHVTDNKIIQLANEFDKVIIQFRLQMHDTDKFEYYEDEDTDKLLLKALSEKNITFDEVVNAAKKLQEEIDLRRKNIHMLMEKTNLSYLICCRAYIDNDNDYDLAYKQLKEDYLA